MSNKSNTTIFGENYFLQEGFFDKMKKKKQEKEAAKKKADEAKWWNREQDHLIELKNKYDKFIKKAWELDDSEYDFLYFAKCMGMTESKLISLYKSAKQIPVRNYIYEDKYAKVLGSSATLNTKVTPVYTNDDYAVFIYNNTIYEWVNSINKSTFDRVANSASESADFDKSDIQKMIKQNWKKVEVEI